MLCRRWFGLPRSFALLAPSRLVGDVRVLRSANLRHVRARYPGVPGVAYTRKGLLADAIQLLSLGADGIYMKPGGATDEDIRAATIAQRDDLMRAWLSRL